MWPIEVPQQPPMRFDAVLLDEAFQPGGEVGGVERIVGVAVHQFREAGVGLDGDQAGPVGGEPADMFGHFLRAGGAVQAHQRDVECADHGGGGGDVGADEQRAGGLDGDLDEDRRVGAGVAAGDFCAVDRSFDLQRVLAGLDQDGVDVAVDQAAALLCQCGFERVVGDVAEAGQFGAGADTADDPAGAVVGEAFGGFAGEFAGLAG